LKSVSATNQLGVLLAGGQALLEHVSSDELDPRSVMAAYQQWYTPTLAVVGALIPARRPEFEAYYRRSDGSSSPGPCIADILAHPPLDGERAAGLAEIFDPATPRLVFLHLLGLQLAILGSAQSLLASEAAPTKGSVTAGLLEAELVAAEELSAYGRRGAAAALASVVVEQHFAALARQQGLSIVKPSGIAALAKVLCKAGLLDAGQYREARRFAKLAERRRAAKQPAQGGKNVRRLIAQARRIVRETR
jgi:hypothetical protein